MSDATMIRVLSGYVEALEAELAAQRHEGRALHLRAETAIKERDAARSEGDRAFTRMRERFDAELAERTRERDAARADRDVLRYACECANVTVHNVTFDGEDLPTRKKIV